MNDEDVNDFMEDNAPFPVVNVQQMQFEDLQEQGHSALKWLRIARRL